MDSPRKLWLYKTKENTESAGFKYLHYAFVANVVGYSTDNPASYNDVVYLNCRADFVNEELST
jgi:hypothetical protein